MNWILAIILRICSLVAGVISTLCILDFQQSDIYMCPSNFETILCNQIVGTECISEQYGIKQCQINWVKEKDVINETSKIISIHVRKIDNSTWSTQMGTKCYLFGDIKREVKC